MLVVNEVEWAAIKDSYHTDELTKDWWYYVVLDTPNGCMIGNFYNDLEQDMWFVGVCTPVGFLKANQVGATHIAMIALIQKEVSDV